jgi:hypothetical protein
MVAYVSRGGELTVENEAGERLSGRAALAEVRSQWEPFFDNRAASRDIGVFHVGVDAASIDAADGDHDALVREILRAGFGARRFVYAVKEISSRELMVSGVLVLRDSGGERLTGDSKAASVIQDRFDKSDFAARIGASFRFHGYGNGVEYGTARVRDLIGRSGGKVRDETGRIVADAKQAGDLVQKEWRKELHSRRGRDVMHLIVSARAQTDLTAFQGAVRDFLAAQFAGHHYVFAMHDPADDPKAMCEGGKRPHIHAHAIVTMRSADGTRIETSPKVFREWRAVMAQKARVHGINMEMTDRREFASAPAYARNQVRPVSYTGRTEHEGTSEAARVRYEAKRMNLRQMAGSSRSTVYASAAAETWRGLAVSAGETLVADYAQSQLHRIELAIMRSQIGIENSGVAAEAINFRSNMVLLQEFISGDEVDMREMTRPEFEAYEARVETVLSTVEESLQAGEREDFDQIVAAAREVVSIRREYLDLTEQHAVTGREPHLTDNEGWDRAAPQRDGVVVEQGNDVMIEIETARAAIDRTEDHDRRTASAQADLRRELERAAHLAVAGNTYVREISETDHDLRRAIEAAEHVGQQSRPNFNRTGEKEAAETVGEPVRDSATAGAAKGDGGLPNSIGVETEQLRDLPLERAGDASARRETEYGQSLEWHVGRRAPVSDDRDVDTLQQAEGRSELRSDPPQQLVPRHQELERETEERHERDRDDYER